MSGLSLLFVMVGCPAFAEPTLPEGRPSPNKALRPATVAADQLPKSLLHKALNDKVSVDVYLTKVRPNRSSAWTKAWCYKTSGVQPREYTITVVQLDNEKDENFPTQPLDLLKSLVDAKGQSLSPNQVADFGGKTFLGPSMVGMLIVNGDQLEGVPEANLTCSLVAITKKEIEVADLAGPSRLMGLLAHQSSYYPCPVWCDRTRSETCSDKEIELMKADPAMRTRQLQSSASLMISEERGNLWVTEAEAKLLGERLLASQDKGLRVALTMDSRAQAFLVWVPADSNPVAVTPDGSNGSPLSGQFLLVAQDKTKELFTRLDDGFVLLLNSEHYLELANSLKAAKPISLKVTGPMAKLFEVEYKQTEYFNPAEGKTYTVPQGMVSYQSDQPAPPPSGPVDLKEIVLLTPDQELSRALTVDELVAYTKAIQATVIAGLQDLHSQLEHEVAVQCELSTDGIPKYRVGMGPPLDGVEPLMKKLYESLAGVKAPKSRGLAKFVLHFKVMPH